MENGAREASALGMENCFVSLRAKNIARKHC
jgi:hypothetical protein